jgi:hypothetical protein
MDETYRRGHEVVNIYDAFISYTSLDSEVVENLPSRFDDHPCRTVQTFRTQRL